MSNLFQKLEIEAFRAGITPRTKESMEWFRKKATELGRPGKSLLRDESLKQQTGLGGTPSGKMFMFFYDPKYKKTLPYYDKFPLVIVVGPAEGGFHGLNLHYLPPVLRAKFLDGLMDRVNNKKFDETTTFNLTYSYLKKASDMSYFKPCFKHYLTQHVTSKFAMVQPPEWEIATFLPTAQFTSSSAKVSSSRVYTDSKRMV